MSKFITFNFIIINTFILSCGGGNNGIENNSSSSIDVTYIGWSGNWWAEDDFRIYLLNLITLDSINYTGNIQITNKQYGNILTADLTGQYGWGLHLSLCSSINDYNWMLITLYNIQGQINIGEDILSGTITFNDYCLKDKCATE